MIPISTFRLHFKISEVTLRVARIVGVGCKNSVGQLVIMNLLCTVCCVGQHRMNYYFMHASLCTALLYLVLLKSVRYRRSDVAVRTAI